MSATKAIRLIVKRHELVRNGDGNIIAVVPKLETRDYEIKNYFGDTLEDNDNCKHEIVSAEFVDVPQTAHV